jgi:thiamine pyrophosphokinase
LDLSGTPPGELGKCRAERVTIVTDPWNLSWVMPAEGGANVVHPSSGVPVVNAVVLAGGEALHGEAAEHAAALLAAAPLVVAADGGAAHARRLGGAVDVLVGDLDSVESADLALMRARGTEVLEHPVDKDATDLALALDLVLNRSAGPNVHVIGGHGGRLDHLLGNALLLASERYRTLRLHAVWDSARLHVVRDEVTLSGRPGALVSLMALHGRARGVTTDGLRFRLDGADLEPGSSLGLSNRFDGPIATVHVRAGVVLVVQPTDTSETTDR